MPQLERSDAKAIEFLKETLEIGVYTKIKVAHGKRNPSKHAFLGRVRISILCSGETEGVVLRGQQELQWRRLEKRGWFSHISGRLGYVFLHLLILLTPDTVCIHVLCMHFLCLTAETAMTIHVQNLILSSLHHAVQALCSVLFLLQHQNLLL